MNKLRIKYVAQRQKKDCVIACLAMILPASYESIIQNFWTDFDRQGIELEHAANYLMDCGFFTIIKEGIGSPNNSMHNELMWKPFADVHIVSVRQFVDRKTAHAVVMSSTGKIYDPGQLKSSKKDYYEVIKVLGLFSHNIPKTGKK